MTALTQDTPVKRVYSDLATYPVLAAAKIYEGSLVGLTDAGYATPIVAGGAYVFVGHADAQADNSASGAASGDVNVHVRHGRYRLEVAITGAALGREGQPVYAADDGAVTFDPMATTSANTFVGRFQHYVSSGIGVVEFITADSEPLLTNPLDPGQVIRFFDDFDYSVLDSAYRWAVVDVAAATETIAADEPGGALQLLIAVGDEAEDAVCYMKDELIFNINKLRTMRFRYKVITPGAGVRIVAGMAGNHNLDKDTVAQNAWISFDASMDAKAETDDGTTDNDDKAIATQVTDTWYEAMIDFRTVTNIKFYINGIQVATGTTFSMAAYTGGLQPYFSCDKAGGAVTSQLLIDWVEIIAER